jgi:acyl carrier protein
MGARVPYSRHDSYQAHLGGWPLTDKIREIIREHGRLAVDVASLADNSDLYLAGMTSHASVNVMLALEGAFDIEFPDRMLRRGVFESIESIRAAIDEVRSSG